MTKKGRISVFELGKTVIEYIKEQDKIHIHDIMNMTGVQDILDNINLVNIKLADKSDKNHTHTPDELDDSFVVNITNINRGFLYNNSDTINSVTSSNYEVIIPSDAEATGDVIKTKLVGDYKLIFNIPRNITPIGICNYKIRFKTEGNITGQSPKLKINSVNRFDSADNKEYHTILDTVLNLVGSSDNFVEIYGTVDLKLITKNSVGLEISVEHTSKTGDYILLLDGITIAPAFPGIFIN
ncbi:MAG: hypothetical protein ACRCXT_03020 [Paraclostridium sp.]